MTRDGAERSSGKVRAPERGCPDKYPLELLQIFKDSRSDVGKAFRKGCRAPGSAWHFSHGLPVPKGKRPGLEPPSVVSKDKYREFG